MSHRVQALELRELQRQIQIDSTPDDGGSNVKVALAPGFPPSFPPGLDPTSEPVLEEKTVTAQFTEELKRSWVYSRNSAFRLSTYSSEQAFTKWSCLSRLSMSEVSDISVFSLAISVEEVKNPKRLSQTWSNDQDISSGNAIAQVLRQGSNPISTEYAGISRLPLPSDDLEDEIPSDATTTNMIKNHGIEPLSTTSATQAISAVVDFENSRSTSPTVQDSGLFSKTLRVVASVYAFNDDKSKGEGGFSWLLYVAGEVRLRKSSILQKSWLNVI